jgi:hypothetical protein
MDNELVRYRFEVLMQPKKLQEMSEFMKKLDLNTGDICIREEVSFVRNGERPIEELKQIIKEAYDCVETKVLKIEGGKIE